MSTLRVQAKHIPTDAILAMLANEEYEYGLGAHLREVSALFDDRFPWKVVLAKMRGLIKRGLVSGCDCGCRGDFEITAAGRRALAHTEEATQ